MFANPLRNPDVSNFKRKTPGEDIDIGWGFSSNDWR
jgi:hypothetical protein